MQKSQKIDMTGGSLLRSLWFFSLPLIAANLLQMLFNAADTIVVGRFSGQQALAAVGATSSLCFMLIAFFNGLSIGTNVVVAKYLGAGNRERVVTSVHTSMALSVICGVITAVLGTVVSRPMLELMSTPSDIIDQSTLYMRIYFLGMFFGVIYNFGAAVLRAKGDTKRPLYFLLVSGILNAVLNVVFVVGFGLSVAGVAIATAISQAVSAALILISLKRENDDTRLDLRKMSLDREVLSEVFRIGGPAGIQSVMFSMSNVIIQTSINSFGSSIYVAGNSAASNVENFVYIVSNALSQACITFTSQNAGAGRYERIRGIMHLTMLLSISCTIALGMISWVFSSVILGFYTTDPQVIAAGQIRIEWVGRLLFINGIMDVFIASMRGMGFSFIPTVFMIAGICGIRLSWLFFVFPSFRTLTVVYMCFPISWIATSILEGILWKKCHGDIIRNNTGAVHS